MQGRLWRTTSRGNRYFVAIRAEADANGGAAVREAASRLAIHFVPVNTTIQQGMLSGHRLRQGFDQAVEQGFKSQPLQCGHLGTTATGPN